jgi:acyl-coenzyme A thioesterase PaaI-like protein
LEFKLNYLAPTRPGVLRASSRVLSLSKKTAVVAVDCDNDGRLVGTALGTIALSPPRPPA